MIRRDTHAGSWYSDDPVTLKQQISTCLTANHDTIKAIIAPHAGYRYSLKTAGLAYSFINPNDFNRIVLLGPSHKVWVSTMLVSGCDFYQTPFGTIPIDKEWVRKLSKMGVEQMDIRVDENEHSLEMHLPLIYQIMSEYLALTRKMNGSYTLLPIMVGELENVRDCAKLLQPLYEDTQTLFIVSSDFCHWGKRFRYTPSGDLPIHAFIERLDRKAMSCIEKVDYQGFLEYLARSRNTICGRNPILLLLKIIELSPQNYKFNFVGYDQSSKVVDPNDSSVSYASAVLS